MKALWITLAVLAVLGLACCGGVFLFGKNIFNQVAEVHNDADLFSAKIFPEIAKEFNAQTVAKYASRELKEELAQETFPQTLKKFRNKLGAFKSVGEFRANHLKANSVNGKSILEVTTTSTAKFEKGTANVTLFVIKRGEEWKLRGMTLDSQALD